MANLTQAQREALVRIYNRGPLIVRDHFLVTPENGEKPLPLEAVEGWLVPSFFDGCVMLPWQHMWLGIEPDGYTHS